MDEEVKIAKAAADVQFAINLLNPRLLQFIQAKEPGKKKTDFNKSVQFISRNVKQYFPGSNNKRTIFERANVIRNKYSHQDFDINRFEHDVECLAKIASYIEAPDVEQQIRALIPSDCSTECSPTHWEKLKEEGKQHYKDSKWTEAMNCYTKAIRLNPKVAVLYSNRALCEIQLSKFQLAREDAEDALEMDPKQVKTYRILSNALYHLSKFEEALSIVELGLTLDPRDEVLLIRHRDCTAIKKIEEINKHSVAGGDLLFNDPEFMKQLIKQMNPTGVLPEDILEVENNVILIFFEMNQAHHILKDAKGKIDEELKAFAIFESAAKKGHAGGLYYASLMYKNSQASLPRDFLKALDYCRKAAAQKPFIKFQGFVFPNIGVSEAENELGIAYRDGAGVDKNDIRSFNWFLKSAQHNCSSGQNNLGVALRFGIGCSHNIESARDWFEKATELGQSEARYNLADMLIKGQGGPVDPKKAAKLLKEAADQGLPGALAQLQNLLRSGRDGLKSMTDSIELVSERAKEDDMEARFLLGLNYLYGTGGFEKDLDLAEENLRKASELNHPDADLVLGKLLLETKQNDEAFHFIKQAAENRGNLEAQRLLGEFYAYGEGCERDEAKSRRWLERAKRSGYQPTKIAFNQFHEMDDVTSTIFFGEQLNIFEKDNNLTSSGMSFIERNHRMMLSIASKSNTVVDLLNLLKQSLENEPSPNICSTNNEINEWLPEMLKRKEKGSKIAERFFKARDMIDEAFGLLKSNEISKAFSLWRVATIRVFDVLPVPNYILDKFQKAAENALENNSQNADALFVKCHCDMLKRFNKHDQLLMAKRCIELDPSIAEYHSFLGTIYSFRQEFDNAIRCYDRALELESHPEWMYERASSMRLNSDLKNPSEIIKAYLQYLSSCEPDSRNVPESNYCIGFTYTIMGEMKKAEEYYTKGTASEEPNIRLPCFGPVKDDFPPKFSLKKMLKMNKASLDPMKQFLVSNVDEVSQCENCGTEGVSLKCSRCKIVKYCNSQCQKSHWKTHKKNCR